MRRIAICLALFAGTAATVAPAARAQERPACEVGDGPYSGEELNRLGVLAQPVAGEAEAWLGEQFAGFWVQPRDGNWYVAVAPGPVGPERARERVLELVDARYDGEDEARLRARLRMSEQPYGRPELARVQEELVRRLSERHLSVSWSLGAGCTLSTEVRVELVLYRDASPEVYAEAARFAEPFGDRVRTAHLRDVQGPTPTAGALAAPPALDRLQRMRRTGACATGRWLRIALRGAAGRGVAAVEVRLRGRRIVLRGARLRRGARVRLPVSGARVAVTALLADGRRSSGIRRAAACR